MAELTPKTINEMPETTAPTDETLFPVSKGGSSFRLTWSTVKEKIFSAVMALRGSVPNGTDINTVLTPGVYTIASTSTYTNLPAGVKYGTLHVFRGASTSTIITQILVTTRGRQYNRIQTNGEWSAWADASMPDVLPIERGGLGATTYEQARSALGLNGQLSYSSVATNSTKNYTLENGGRYVFFLTGAPAAARRIINVFVRSTDGAVLYSDLVAGQPTGLTITATTRKLSFDNASGGTVYVTTLCMGTSAPPA